MPTLEPKDYQPALGWWGHLWRILVAVALGALAWTELAIWQWEYDRAWFFVDAAGGLCSLVLMQYRRQRPVAVALAVLAIGIVSASSSGAITVIIASLATRRRWREIAPLAALSMLQWMAFELYNPVSVENWWLTSPVVLMVIAATVATGLYIGSRRELLVTLEDRARTAENEQVVRISQARTAERARIAREMHDVLAHRISLVAMHAGALTYRTDLTPAEVRKASAVIQDNAHEALTDLREVLGILRGDDPDESERPQPSLQDIPRLVDDARSVGLQVDYSDGLGAAQVPDSVGRTAYRIVQEALTNARKHAPDTSVRASISGAPGRGIVVEVCNPLRIGHHGATAPRSGLGLVGLAERAALSGGTLTHEITDDSTFVLRAQLPWRV
ncbi:MAG: sensor histidine kinase [Nocardioidaceae bacterium]